MITEIADKACLAVMCFVLSLLDVADEVHACTKRRKKIEESV